MLVDMESGEDASWRKAHALRGVLDEGDAMAGYEEETVSPVTVLGVEASYTTLMSTSGFVATGFIGPSRAAAQWGCYWRKKPRVQIFFWNSHLTLRACNHKVGLVSCRRGGDTMR